MSDFTASKFNLKYNLDSLIICFQTGMFKDKVAKKEVLQVDHFFEATLYVSTQEAFKALCKVALSTHLEILKRPEHKRQQVSTFLVYTGDHKLCNTTYSSKS